MAVTFRAQTQYYALKEVNTTKPSTFDAGGISRQYDDEEF